MSLSRCAGTKLGIAPCADFGHFVLAYADQLTEKLELEPGKLVQAIDVQGYLVAATDSAVEDPDKDVVGFLLIAQMQQVWIGVCAFAGAGGVCGHFLGFLHPICDQSFDFSQSVFGSPKSGPMETSLLALPKMGFGARIKATDWKTMPLVPMMTTSWSFAALMKSVENLRLPVLLKFKSSIVVFLWATEFDKWDMLITERYATIQPPIQC